MEKIALEKEGKVPSNQEEAKNNLNIFGFQRDRQPSQSHQELFTSEENKKPFPKLKKGLTIAHRKA